MASGKRIVELPDDYVEGDEGSEDETYWAEQPAHATNRAGRRAEALRVLDVESNEDASAVRQAYRKLAMKHHPDTSRGDPDAEQKFREVVKAYETLSREYGLMGEDSPLDRFESAEDMREFAASFFESFFFGAASGGFGGRSGGFGRRGDDDASSRDYDSDGESIPSLDDYDDDDDYTDDDDEYTDLHNFFGSNGPPGWGKRGMPSKWFGRQDGDYMPSGGSQGRPSMTEDQLFEHLEQMRKEAARYAAELAKQENEARRAAEPLEKLQRPTLVSRTDDSITLNLYRTKSTTQTLPEDRCWELSLKKEKDQNFIVFTSIKGKTIVTVNELTPGTKYCFKARVGRLNADTGEVTEWGPYSVESAYVTSGRAPVATSGKHNAKGESDEAVVEAGMGKKAKKRAAKEQAEKEERERAAAAAEKKSNDNSAAEEAAARQAALRKAAEEAAEREMAEMEAIRKRLEAAKKPETKVESASTGEGLSKKAAQRKKKKERAKAEEAAKLAERENGSAFPAETDEELARRLQAEEDRASMLADSRYKQTSAPNPPPPSGPPPSWAAAPAMRVPGMNSEPAPPRGPPPGGPRPPPSAPPPGQSRVPLPRGGNDEPPAAVVMPPPLPPGPRPPAAYGGNAQPPLPTQQASAPPPGAWGSQPGSQASDVQNRGWSGAGPAQPPMGAQPPQPSAPQVAPVHSQQPASWSPANSNWQPMGQGMGSLPVGDVFANEGSRSFSASGDIFASSLDQNQWSSAAVSDPQWGGQTSTWTEGAARASQAGAADWGLGGLGVNTDLNPGGSTWSAFGDSSTNAGPGVWSNAAPNDLSVDMSRMNVSSSTPPRQPPHPGAPRSPATPDGDPSLIDSSLLSFLG